MAMKSFRQWISTLFVLVLLQSAMGGCSHTQQSQFYTLNPVQPGSAGSAAQNWSASTDSAAGTDVAVAKPPMTIAIMAVEIPDYLDRPQIVTRNTANEISLSEYERWAGDLRNDISRVLAETLSSELPRNRVFILNGRRAAPSTDYNISVQVKRFESMPGGQVWLEAQWSILGNTGQSVLLRGNTNLSEPTEGQNSSQLVSAMSRAVDRMGQQIARAVKEIMATPPTASRG